MQALSLGGGFGAHWARWFYSCPNPAPPLPFLHVSSIARSYVASLQRSVEAVSGSAGGGWWVALAVAQVSVLGVLLVICENRCHP